MIDIFGLSANYSIHLGNELVNVLNNAYPDLTEIILQDTYGKILSDTRFITPMETELSAVGVLYAMQAYGHMAGHMKGSRNMGATEEQADKVVALAKAITAPLDGKWE
ncbi:hypothetical protein BDF22DRAFT_746020 [Syncephalis plumigaleata]|nr:hypothetical protein BDF22DRAFT_746020 [Syncephalis plumigaleata]